MENAVTAIHVVEILKSRGFTVTQDSIVRGFASVRWPARLEVLSHTDNTVVVDGAHNPYSMKRLVQAIRDYFRFQQVILIFGTLGGHSANGMIAELANLSPLVCAVRSRHPKSASSKTISQVASEAGLPVIFQSDNVGEATRNALRTAGKDDLVLGTGSLTVAAEVIEEIKGIEPELYPYINSSWDCWNDKGG